MSNILDAAGLPSDTTLAVMATRMTQNFAATGDKSRAQSEGLDFLGRQMMNALMETRGR